MNVSIFLKKVNKKRASIEFKEQEISVDLPTTDMKRYKTTIPLYAKISPKDCAYTVMGTKVEMKLQKGELQVV